MATVPVAFVRSASVPTGGATWYTVPANKQAVVTCITVSNSTAAVIKITVSLQGVPALNGVNVPANGTATYSFSHPLATAFTISGSATAAGVSLLVSGVLIDTY